MSRYLAAFAALALVAAAIFLPGKLAEWNDLALLDEPHIDRQEEAREGFGERMQLSVAEKLLLLRTGELSQVPLEDVFLTDTGEEVSVRYAINAGNVVLYQGENTPMTDEGDYAGLSAASVGASYELGTAAEALTKEWAARLESVQSELRILRSAGAIPSLWSDSDTVEVSGRSQAVYVDRDTQLSFRTYSMTLSCSPYSLSVTVDAQSGKILGFLLRWSSGTQLSWGYRGAANFGTAWRDYWGMDSVVSSWFTPYNKVILEETEDTVRVNGDYNANSQIGFRYNDQTVSIPLTSYATSSRGCAIGWNP